MNCHEFEQRLQQRLDDRLAPRCTELESHAETCSTCNLSLQDAVLLSRGVAAWQADLPAPSVDLTTRLTEQILQVVQPQPVVRRPELRVDRQLSTREAPSSWQTWTVLAGTVAAIWFVFAGGSIQRPDQGNRLAKSAVHGPSSTAKADLGSVLVSAEGAYSKLATDSLAAAQDFALLWPSRNVVTASDSTPATATINAGDSTWTPDLSRELTPIGNSVGDALDFLSRTVPRIEKTPL